MGGRGAASGRGKHKYGTEFKAVMTVGNIKFIKNKMANSSKAPLETQTRGRVYANVNSNNEISSITYYDNKSGKRTKTIDLKHSHGEIKGVHTHHGYEHNEYDGKKGATKPTQKERKMLDNVIRLWNNKKAGSSIGEITR